MTRTELEQFHRDLEDCDRCRCWTWEEPVLHYPFLRAWPPGYRAALARWDRLPWRVRQLLVVSDHQALEPGLVVWRRDLGFDVCLLSRQTYSETEFRLLAKVAVGSMAFLRGLLWRADPQVAICKDWSSVQALLVQRERGPVEKDSQTVHLER